MANDLPELPSLQPGHYRHYKGGEYEVLGVVRHSESLEPLVLYRPLYNDTGAWVRPFSMFLEPVVHGGTAQPRFSLLRAGSSASEAELSATVQRMEAGLSASPAPAVQHLMQLYGALTTRFERDLAGCPRDLSLAKASALMLVQSAAQAESAS